MKSIFEVFMNVQSLRQRGGLGIGQDELPKTFMPKCALKNGLTNPFYSVAILNSIRYQRIPIAANICFAIRLSHFILNNYTFFTEGDLP
ncbi:MAG: hypothetical protein PHC50_09980 [Candidatus Cloacimonetes bacterium]|nr:hypothetical protein [Candidatus Cloacimonadota bacterium]